MHRQCCAQQDRQWYTLARGEDATKIPSRIREVLVYPRARGRAGWLPRLSILIKRYTLARGGEPLVQQLVPHVAKEIEKQPAPHDEEHESEHGVHWSTKRAPNRAPNRGGRSGTCRRPQGHGGCRLCLGVRGISGRHSGWSDGPAGRGYLARRGNPQVAVFCSLLPVSQSRHPILRRPPSGRRTNRAQTTGSSLASVRPVAQCTATCGSRR